MLKKRISFLLHKKEVSNVFSFLIKNENLSLK